MLRAGWDRDRVMAEINARGETNLAFLCHPTLTDEQVARTCEVLGEVMSVALPRDLR